MLALTVFMLIVADILPQTSEVVPLISIYFTSILIEVSNVCSNLANLGSVLVYRYTRTETEGLNNGLQSSSTRERNETQNEMM